MPRALSLYLPAWPLDLLARRMRRCGLASRGRRERPLRDERAVLLVDTAGNTQAVAHGCAVAARAGVRAGMTLAHARAILPAGVLVAPHTPQRDAAALVALAEWAVRFAPKVAPDPPDGLLMDITGCERMYGGERVLLDKLGAALSRLGLAGRLAAAPTYGCAWAAARFGPSEKSVVPDRGERASIAPLPVRALRIGEQAAVALAEVGITTVAQLYRLPRSALPARFGPELLLRLDQALGDAMELIEPVRPCEPLRVERLFDGPSSNLESVMLAARGLVDTLCAALAARESGARGLGLTLLRSDTEPLLLAVALSRPSRSPKHLWSLLRPRVESANLGFGVEGMILEAASTGRIRHEQAACWAGASGGQADSGAFGELIDTLVNRCGRERVVRLEPVATHIPERTAHPVPVMDGRPGTDAPLKSADRPSVLFDRPEPIDVMAVTPDGPPSWLRWRGKDRTVTTGIGPERIGHEWWRGRAAARDYFKVQDQDGLWLWVYRELEGGRWFAHGLWA